MKMHYQVFNFQLYSFQYILSLFSYANISKRNPHLPSTVHIPFHFVKALTGS